MLEIKNDLMERLLNQEKEYNLDIYQIQSVYFLKNFGMIIII